MTLLSVRRDPKNVPFVSPIRCTVSVVLDGASQIGDLVGLIGELALQ